jgi:hypothetical protein
MSRRIGRRCARASRRARNEKRSAIPFPSAPFSSVLCPPFSCGVSTLRRLSHVGCLCPIESKCLTSSFPSFEACLRVFLLFALPSRVVSSKVFSKDVLTAAATRAAAGWPAPAPVCFGPLLAHIPSCAFARQRTAAHHGGHQRGTPRHTVCPLPQARTGAVSSATGKLAPSAHRRHGEEATGRVAKPATRMQ